MLTYDLRRRLFWGLVWSVLVLGVMGCQATSRQNTTASPAFERVNAVSPGRTHPTPTPSHTRPQITERTAAPTQGESVEESSAPIPEEEPRAVPSQPLPRKPGKHQRPTDRQDKEDRHPSKWQERLRAKYA